MNFFKKFSTFHKVYFLIFLILNLILFCVPLVQGQDLTLLVVAGLVSTLSGLFAGIYTARAEVAAYVWGVVNTVFYIIISVSNHMYAEVILYVVYMLPMNIYGFFAWSKSAKEAKHVGDETASTIEVKSLKASNWIYIIIGVLVVWAAYGAFVYFLPDIFNVVAGVKIPGDKVWYIDSFTATITIFAVVVSTLRYRETWYFWIVGDGVGIILYLISLVDHLNAGQGFSFSTLSGSIMWIQFTVNAVYGLMVWKKLGKEQGGQEKTA
ncbi:MAG: nicotinamide riboside transporter PnuC [Sarcina sp.]